jgi:hypothetical protein
MLHAEGARSDAPRQDVGTMLGGGELLQGFTMISISAGKLARAHPPNPVFSDTGELLFEDCNTGTMARFEAVSSESGNLRGF